MFRFALVDRHAYVADVTIFASEEGGISVGLGKGGVFVRMINGMSGFGFQRDGSSQMGL